MIKRKKNLKKKRHKIQRKSTFIAFYLRIIPSPIVQKYRCNFIKRRPKISGGFITRNIDEQEVDKRRRAGRVHLLRVHLLWHYHIRVGEKLTKSGPISPSTIPHHTHLLQTVLLVFVKATYLVVIIFISNACV